MAQYTTTRPAIVPAVQRLSIVVIVALVAINTPVAASLMRVPSSWLASINLALGLVLAAVTAVGLAVDTHSST